jgi:hypothetical protein
VCPLLAGIGQVPAREANAASLRQRPGFDHLDARAGQHRVERACELPGPITDEESEPRHLFAEVRDEVAGLLHGPRPVRVLGHAQDVQVAVAELEREQDVEPPERYRAVDVEEVDREHAVAWVRRNCRHVVSVCHTGAGGMQWRLRIRRIVEASTRRPSLSSSPWILCCYPQWGLSVAIRTTTAFLAAVELLPPGHQPGPVLPVDGARSAKPSSEVSEAARNRTHTAPAATIPDHWTGPGQTDRRPSPCRRLNGPSDSSEH